MRGKKGLVAAVLVVGILALAGGGVWYMSVPHTAEQQFAYAEKLEIKLRGDAVSKTATEIAPDMQRVEKEFHKVGENYGKNPRAAEALKRIAALERDLSADDAKEMAALEELGKDYPDEPNEGFALKREAEILTKQGDDAKAAKKEGAAEKYHAALDKLTKFQSDFKDTKEGDDTLMRIGRIWMDGLGDPLIKAIESFEQVLKDYPQTQYEDEALYRLGKLYELAKDYQKAMQLYAELVDKYPKSDWAAKATFDRGKIEAEQMDDQAAAAKDFERLQKEHPDSPLAGQARAAEGEAKKGEAEQDNQKYGQGRYGGAEPSDTSYDKPVPPAALYHQFIVQKLDAEKYDLTVTFDPPKHGIAVEGTLKLANKGDEKKELLLMLGAPLEVARLTVDGKKAEFTHSGQTLRVTLPEAVATGKEITLGFAYSGRYAEPNAPELMRQYEMMMGTGSGSGGKRIDKSTTQPAGGAATGPATGPATAGAEKAGAVDPERMKLAFEPQMGLGEYGYALSGASWYPVTVLGDVFEAHTVYKIADDKDEAVGTGVLVKKDLSGKAGGVRTFEFDTHQPVFGLYFAYGPYVVQEKESNGIHFYSYLMAAHAEKSDAYIETAGKILGFYGEKFGGFPYEKLALVEVPLPPFLGGVGPASLMFLQDGFVAHRELPEFLLAHELAHQWFGNLIPINMTDPGYNQWLSEGFATYCDALYTEHTAGEQALATHMQRFGQLYFQFAMLARRGTGSIRDTDQSNPMMYRPVIYEKGAIVLHMLRKVMGDEKFFKLMRQYVDTYKNQLTTVDDFEKLAGKVNGEDLSWFFAEWVDGTVFAHWKVAVESKGDGKGGSPVQSTVTVTQPDDLVKMPADITVYGAAPGQKQVVANVMLDKKEQAVMVSTPFVPVKVVVDEEFWVLHRPGNDNVWEAAPAK